mgnify:CR=1 FL=1
MTFLRDAVETICHFARGNHNLHASPSNLEMQFPFWESGIHCGNHAATL